MAEHAGPGDNPDAEPVQAVHQRVDGKRMAAACYAVAAPAGPDDGTAAGLDMNARQVAVSADRCARIVHAPDSRRLAERCRDWQHRVRRPLVGGTVVVDELRPLAMTASAIDTVAASGTASRPEPRDPSDGGQRTAEWAASPVPADDARHRGSRVSRQPAADA